MNRKWMLIVGIAVAALALVAAGCGPKAPATPPEDVVAPTPVEPEPEEVRAPSPPSIAEDKTPDPLSQDLQQVNIHVIEKGLIGHVYFDFDKYDLKPEARDRLARNAEFLNAHPEFVVSIEGHCDERGTNEYNLALGERRSNAARDYLISLGVSGSRLKTISYGEERAVCTESNEACWWRNRRGHFVISGRS
jgi:peptidoglycan-associated lipoprotein